MEWQRQVSQGYLSTARQLVEKRRLALQYQAPSQTGIEMIEQQRIRKQTEDSSSLRLFLDPSLLSQFLIRDTISQITQRLEMPSKIAKTTTSSSSSFSFSERPLDKAFACHWLDNERLLIGTKSGHLLEWNCCSPQNNLTSIELPDYQSDLGEYPLDRSGIHFISSDPCGHIIATGSHNTCDVTLFEVTEKKASLPITNYQYISDESDEKETAEDEEVDDLETKSSVFLDPLPQHSKSLLDFLILQGHKDWVFDSVFIHGHERLLTASRDNTVKLWSTSSDHHPSDLPFSSDLPDSPPSLPVHSIPSSKIDSSTFLQRGGTVRGPLLTRREHKHKVRAIAASQKDTNFFTISSDLTCKIWDFSNMDIVHTVNVINDSSDLSCIDHEDDLSLCAVGTERSILLIDTRARKMIDKFVFETGIGARSVSFCRDVMTVGSSGGGLMFFDLRFLSDPKRVLAIDNLPSCDFHSAVFSHAWDHHGGRLVVAGGPLCLAESGYHVSVWTS